MWFCDWISTEICFAVPMSLQIVVSLSDINVVFVLIVSMLSTLFRIGVNFVGETKFVQWHFCLEFHFTNFRYSGDLEITVEFITEIDKLVQLIESPIFACKSSNRLMQTMNNLISTNLALRLTLVNNNDRTDARHLSQALFGILMLLPQTEAFKCLSNRLQCVPNYWGQPSKE